MGGGGKNKTKTPERDVFNDNPHSLGEENCKNDHS